VLVDKAQGYGMMLVAEMMPFNYSRREFTRLYGHRESILVELNEQIVQHLRHPDRVPDLMMDNGIPHVMHSIMFRSLDPEVRRRASEIVRFFCSKQDQMFHSEERIRIFDEYRVGDTDWLWATADRFLDEPIGPLMCGFNGVSGLKERLAELTISSHDVEG
jgi:hypothetical protein